MSISATIPISQQQSANDELELAGFGPNSFSVPLLNTSGVQSHVGLHAWDNEELLTALKGITNCRVTSVPGLSVSFDDHIAFYPLERVPHDPS